MKTTIKVEKEIDIRFVRIDIPVRYEEEDIANDFPLRSGDNWNALVCVDDGLIKDWPLGLSAEFDMKVCDQGIYTLYDENMVEIKRINDYVPHGVVPGEYGDYVNLEIDEAGIITNWPKKLNFSKFFKDGNDDE